MIHERTFKNIEVLPGVFMSSHSILPDILKIFKGKMYVVTDGGVSVGDEIVCQFRCRTFVVDEIIEQRPARGDWSGDSHKGTNPTFAIIAATVKPVTRGA